jgi:hypothetical protein
MVVTLGVAEYELTSAPRSPKIPITSPAVIGIFTGMFPAVGLAWVRNNVVNALVVAGNAGGGVAPVNLTTAIFWLPAEASVGTRSAVIVKLTGAVKK